MRYLVCFLVLVFSVQAQAQDRNVVHGEIELERADKKKDPYIVAQDTAIEYFSKLPERLTNLKTSGEKLEDLEEPVATHMAFAYLFCSIRRGTCEEIIDAVLEIDTANSALSGEPACPNMKRFWKAWIANDMEKRQSFAVKTGFIGITTAFKREKLPRYLKCEDTIKDILVDAGEEILFERYKDESRQVKNAKQVAGMLKSIKKKVPNLVVATQ